MLPDRKPKIQLPATAPGRWTGPVRLVLTSPGKLGAVLTGIGLLFSGVPALVVWMGVALMAIGVARAGLTWVRSAPGAAVAAVEDPDYARTKSEIRGLRVLDGVEPQGQALYDQLEQAKLIQKQFGSVLVKRLAPGEVTFARFEAPFAALYLSVLNRISALGVDLRTWAAVRDPQSKTALETQWKSALQSTRDAITEMERTVVALGGMQTGQGSSAREMTEALENLKSIASRIERFSKPT